MLGWWGKRGVVHGMCSGHNMDQKPTVTPIKEGELIKKSFLNRKLIKNKSWSSSSLDSGSDCWWANCGEIMSAHVNCDFDMHGGIFPNVNWVFE